MCGGRKEEEVYVVCVRLFACVGVHVCDVMCTCVHVIHVQAHQYTCVYVRASYSVCVCV